MFFGSKYFFPDSPQKLMGHASLLFLIFSKVLEFKFFLLFFVKSIELRKLLQL